MPRTGNKCCMDLYVSKEIWNRIEADRGLVPRSTYTENLLNEALFGNAKEVESVRAC